MKSSSYLAIMMCAFLVVSSNCFAEAAVIIDDQGCSVLDGDGFLASDSDQTVTTSSANGFVILKCKASGAANSTGKAIRFDYENTALPCSIVSANGAVVTTDWHETVSASGNVTLTCRYKEEDA